MRRDWIVGITGEIAKIVSFCKRTGILVRPQREYATKAKSSVVAKRNSGHCNQVWAGIWEKKARTRCITVGKNETEELADWKGEGFGK